MIRILFENLMQLRVDLYDWLGFIICSSRSSTPSTARVRLARLLVRSRLGNKPGKKTKSTNIKPSAALMGVLLVTIMSIYPQLM
jgi:hypothetical protein